MREEGNVAVTKIQKKANQGFKKKKFRKEAPVGAVERNLITQLESKYEEINVESLTSFDKFPLSPKTLKGLKENGYTSPTEIQRATVSLALQGKDILGAAKTGSGKTLAFVIPTLERLFCQQWTRLDGIGAIIITPTRELAYQIFETFRKVGRYHDISAALIIGGKDLKFERSRMGQCNIVICTPGRLLQHMDENPIFDCANLKVLVLDEADRCLDMGFEPTMNAIIANLPPVRQTFLFSATQTKSVKDLVRLSLKDPSYVAVHENDKYTTPNDLEQNYMICELEQKVSVIWSFIKNHLKQKIIIFFASCKEVKYIFEIISKLRPGISILALYGTLHQLKRMNIYDTFCRKSCAVLFATDIAARGLDFPAVHWVVQADCPEDSSTYIHRVGRTARFHHGGKSLLLLLPSEKEIVPELTARKIPINKIEINPNKLQNPVRKMEAFLAKDPALKDSAQRAFVSYIKSVFLMKDKNIFNVHALDTDSFAKSLGMAVPPRVRFLQRINSRKAKINETANQALDNEESAESEVDEDDSTKATPFYVSDNNDSDDEILQVKRKDHDIELPNQTELEQNEKISKKKALTKAAVAKKILKKNIVANKKIIFDDDGTAITVGTKDKRSELAQEYEKELEGGINLERAKLVLREEDVFDKQLFKERVKAKHKETKRKLKQKQRKVADSDVDEESEDDGPDLSWLPDPDKIYGKGDVDERDVVVTEDENSESESLDAKLQKRNSSKKRKKTTNKPSKKHKPDSIINNALTVNEAEDLAMMLLQGKR